jgi:integrase
MATIENRSPWAVTVPRDDNLYREFHCTKEAAARKYADSLTAKSVKARVEQLDNSFQVRARDKGYPKFCVTFATYAEAEKTLKQIEATRALSIFRDFSAATRHTTADLMSRYIKDVCPKHKGGDVEIMRLNRLIRVEDFVDKPLASLTTEDLQDFIDDRLTEVGASTVDRELDLIRQVLRYAADIWKILPSEDPFTGLRRPKYFNERNRRLSDKEFELILEAARADENQYVEPLILLALATAMRRSELLSLTWANINYERREAFLPVTKNGRTRSVPLSKQAIQVLQALPRDAEAIFPITANALQIAFFRRILRKAQIEDLHFHDLRHEAISRLAESNEYSLIDLQAITGHRDVRMLLRYSHLCSRKLAEKMDEVQGTVEEYVYHGRKRRVMVPYEYTKSGTTTVRGSSLQATANGLSPAGAAEPVVPTPLACAISEALGTRRAA